MTSPKLTPRQVAAVLAYQRALLVSKEAEKARAECPYHDWSYLDLQTLTYAATDAAKAVCDALDVLRDALLAEFDPEPKPAAKRKR